MRDAAFSKKKDYSMTDQANTVALSPIEAIDAAIEANKAAGERLQAKRRAIVFRDTVAEGVAVTYNYGRKPNLEVRSGTVLATADVATGPHGGTARKVTVLSGEGINTKVDTVFLNAILTVGDEDVSDAVEADDAAEGDNPLDAA